MGQEVGSRAARHSRPSSCPAQLEGLEVGEVRGLLSPEPRHSYQTEVRDLLHHGRHSGEAAHQNLPTHSAHAEDSCKEREVREVGRARERSEGRQSEKYHQQTERW